MVEIYDKYVFALLKLDLNLLNYLNDLHNSLIFI